MTPEALRLAIETAHARLHPDSHAMLFDVRKVELSELIIETAGVCEADGFLAGHQHFVAALSTPQYALLGQLLVEVPEAWALIDPKVVEPQAFLANLDLFSFLAFPACTEEAVVRAAADVPAAPGQSNVVHLHPTTDEPGMTRAAIDQLDTVPSAPENTAQPTDKMGADEARVRLLFRELMENNTKLLKELVAKRVGMPAAGLVSEKHKMTEGKTIRPSRPMPNGVLPTTLEEFGKEGKEAAVELFTKEFLYAPGGASPAFLAFIRHTNNKFLRNLLRGQMEDADYGRYMHILLEAIQEALDPAA